VTEGSLLYVQVSCNWWLLTP